MLEYHRNIMVWVSKVKGQGHRVNKCFSYYSPQHNSKTNDPKVFKLCIWNDLGISWNGYGFGVESLKVKVTGSISAFFILLSVA